jgi:hypothetical protein
VFLGNGPYPGVLPTAMESLSDRSKSRWIDNNGSQVDSKKLFQLDLDKIKSGEDTRTTLMIKNIPNKYELLTHSNACLLFSLCFSLDTQMIN